MPYALIITISLALLAGCSVTVNNPNIASKNNVAAKADIKADTKVDTRADAKATEPSDEAALARTSEPAPKPPYAMLEGGAEFDRAELSKMIEMGIITEDERPTAWRLPPDKRAYVRSKLIDRAEMLALMSELPPTPTPRQ